VYPVTNSYAWLPRSAWTDNNAWRRLTHWISENSPHEAIPLIVTPQLDNSLNSPDGLRQMADNAERQNEHGHGSKNWMAGDGPIVIVWPRAQTVQRRMQEVAGLSGQSIILLEQETSDPHFPSFQGWANAVGAFNAATDKAENSHPWLAEMLDDVFTSYENELALSPASASAAYPPSAHVLRGKLKGLRTDGYDEDFIVTYAVGLGYQGNLARLREHYRSSSSISG
jgi:hypothetical protein